MIKTICIQKFRDTNNKIIGYRLKDEQGNIKDFTAEAVKEHIRANRIEVINLTLSSNNRLISKEPKEIIEKHLDINKILNRAIVLGLQIKEIPTYCGHKAYLVSKTSDEHILYIPDDVVRPNSRFDLECTAHFKDCKGTLRVIGGQGLKYVNGLFEETIFSTIDLSQLNTSNVIDMCDMFYDCKATRIILDNLDTSQVRYMKGMFKECNVIELDLSNLDTSKVQNMKEMFNRCKASRINISNLNTSRVMDMSSMFKWCNVIELDFSSFRTSNVRDMSFMFHGCTVINKLDLSRFTGKRLKNMYNMFYNCDTLSIDLSNMKITDEVITSGIFDMCYAQIKVENHKLLVEYNNRCKVTANG